MQTVPKTSYYKMIDVWFLFLLILIVLTIIGHTVITVILGPESAENKVFGGQRKRLFNRRGTNSAATHNGSVYENQEDYDEDNEEMTNARTANLVCMAAFIVIFILFNIVFWVYALEEHGSPIENFVTINDE